jgi:LAS superfamily LD-carboxypeptidase LdcB
LCVGHVAPAAGADDPAARRRQVQTDRAKAAAELNVLQASQGQIQRSLDELARNVRAQQAAVDGARRAVDAAAAALDQARRRQEQMAAEVAGLRSRTTALALDAYMGRSTSAMLEALRTGNIADVARKREYASIAMGGISASLDRLRAARQDLNVQRRAAQRAKEQMAARQTDVQARFTQMFLAQQQQLRFAGQVENKIAITTSRADQLAKTDSQLGAQISAQQGQGTSSIAVQRSASTISLTTVRGITVASSIAAQLDKMLAAAEADGFTLTGQGYRSADQQIELRRQHCGSSDYAIYQMDPSQCSPPTARPGTSMHEQGLAVDFIANGSLISSHSDAAWQWLSAHAASYGFYNLPSEPWHWSVNGH